jgi:hypothetical protein
VQALCLLHTQVLKQTDLHGLYTDLASNAGTDSSVTIHVSEVIYQWYVIFLLCDMHQILN